jgi:enoyl-CoA hydratase
MEPDPPLNPRPQAASPRKGEPELAYENLLIDIDGAVATITLNRPHAMNALSQGLMNDYENALTELNRGDAIRVIRLKGAGRAFSAGYDLAQGAGAAASDGNGSPADKGTPALADFGESPVILEREGMRVQIERWLRIWNYRKPVIAQVHGYCLSGGLDLLATTDIAFAAAGTRFGHPASRGVGIPLLLGMLPLKVGASRTKRILFTGDLIDADEAREWGLVDYIADQAELDQRVLDYCRRVAMLPLDALSVHKHVVNRWMEIMGARLGSYEGAEYDALYHTTGAYHEFGRRIAEQGLKKALEWRDGPFKNSPAAN